MSVPESMEEPQQTSQSPNHKRVREEDVEPPISTPKKPVNLDDSDSTPLTSLSSIPSPLPSHPKSSQPAPNSTTNATNLAPSASSTGAQQPAKRRKLTVQEKEEQQREKEAKAKAKAEQKAKKDSEKEAEEKAKAEVKAQKEEEKRAKDEEKRKKAEEREEKKRAKELEQQQKEEAKRKKDQSQTRLHGFFKATPSAAATPPVSINRDATSDAVLLGPNVALQAANIGPVSPQKAIRRQAISEYDRYFLPFELLGASILAPQNRYMEDPDSLAAARSRLDRLIFSEDHSMDVLDAESLRATFSAAESRCFQVTSITEIVDLINGSSTNPIDLTRGDAPVSRDPTQLLKRIPMKYLHFPEDHRPAYWGTYTKPHDSRDSTRLAKNPFSRTLLEADYEYDSEAEWEEQGEGEDLDSDGDEDLDDGSEDEMDDFLDDEDDVQGKRRLISGDLEPISTGLCWQDATGVSRLNDGSGAISTEFNNFSMGFLLEPQPLSIDPFSTVYWAPENVQPTVPSLLGRKQQGNSSMDPPRMPLVQQSANRMLNLLNGSNANTSAASKPVKAVGRLVPDNMLPAFKKAIDGSDLTKIALIEHLKKLFPGTTKDAITNTIKQVAQRVGAKEVDKRWVLNDS